MTAGDDGRDSCEPDVCAPGETRRPAQRSPEPQSPLPASTIYGPRSWCSEVSQTAREMESAGQVNLTEGRTEWLSGRCGAYGSNGCGEASERGGPPRSKGAARRCFDRNPRYWPPRTNKSRRACP